MAAGYLQASAIGQNCNRSKLLKKNIETFFFSVLYSEFKHITCISREYNKI